MSTPPAPRLTRLVLIRHAESNASVSRIVGGPASCTGLSDLGRRQAEALRARLERTGEVQADVLVASAMPRAQETAAIIAPALGGLDVVSDADLREHDPGPEYDGTSWDDFSDTDRARLWGDDPYLAGFPGGETVAGFQFRAGTAVHRLVAGHVGCTVVVVSHGGVIDITLRSLLTWPAVGGFHLWTLNASLTELYRRDIDGARWALRRYNDAAHLEGLPRGTTWEG